MAAQGARRDFHERLERDQAFWAWIQRAPASW